MKSCIVIQCFCKPYETLETLKSLEKCVEIINYNLLLYVDYSDDPKFAEKNKEVIEKISQYKIDNEHKYKNIRIEYNKQNQGPYLTCFYAIELGYTYNDFVIFSEDDIIFCKDTINYYNNYRDKKITYDENCIGISSSSFYFYPSNNNIFEDKGTNKIFDTYTNIVNDIKDLVNNNNLLNTIEHVKTAPNKQMGLFKEGWDKIKNFRDTKNHSYLYNRKSIYKKYVPDVATSVFVKNSQYYFIFSFVPRSNDIGLYNELGCTQLYTDYDHGYSTTKFLTSNDFEQNSNLYQIHPDLESFKSKTIIN
jgi:hypothetical protein